MFSIRSKFNTSILVVAIFSTILTGLISIFQSRRIVEREAKKVLHLTASVYANSFEYELNKLQLHQRSLESFILSISDSLNQQSLKQNQSLIANNVKYYCKHFLPFSLWVVFNPDYFGYPLVISMYDTTGKGNYIFEPNYDIRKYNPQDEEIRWWRDAIKYGEIWTPPYFWEPWNKYLISYSKALYIKGEPIAVMGSDFNFDSLRNHIKSVKVYESGYIWMVDSSLNIICHPRFEGENLKNLKINQEIITTLKDTKNKQGNIEYQFEGIEKNMAFQRLTNGWCVCVTAPNHEIYKGSTLIFRYILFIILLTILISALISHRIASAITKPINRFVESFVKGATGDFSIRVPEISKDEIRLLEFHFNHFLEKTQRMVSEIQETQKSLIEAKNTAEEANSLKLAFLANMSHEIRTPLNSVIGFTTLLKIQDIPESERGKYIDLIISNSYSLLSIVESLIEFSSIEVGKLELKPSTFSVEPFLKSFIDFFTSNYRHKVSESVTVKYNELLSNTPITLFSDQDRIKRVLFHLLDNALKFTSRGAVEIGYYQKSLNEVVFYIKDTGVGIKAENKKLVWESFYKGIASETKFYSGAGLGLSICKKIVGLLNGEIWFDSEFGKGSCFYFTIPITLPPDDYSEEERIILYPEVLIIDRNIDSFRKFHDKLIQFGTKVLWARNGVEALGLITMEPTVKLIVCNLYSDPIEGILSIQLVKNMNPELKILLIGDQTECSELTSRYNIKIDFIADVLVKETDLKAILTSIKQKEQH